MGVREYSILARVVIIGVPEIKRVCASDEDREVHTIPESVSVFCRTYSAWSWIIYFIKSFLTATPEKA